MQKYKNLSEDLLFKKLKSTTLSLKVYYEELTYTLIKESAKLNEVDLISNIGGKLIKNNNIMFI